MTTNKVNKTISVEISAALLNQLAWALPAGNVEKKVDFCLRKAVERGQQEEGITYPEDIEPCTSFEHVEVKT